jgi:thioredoxin-like negative regulator of GroEL
VVDAASFPVEVLKSELPVFVDVTAEWCPPCKAAKPLVAELAQQYAGRLKVVMIDGDASPDLVATLGVRGFPTFLAFYRGDILGRQAGFGGRRSLQALVEKLLAAAQAQAPSASAST